MDVYGGGGYGMLISLFAKDYTLSMSAPGLLFCALCDILNLQQTNLYGLFAQQCVREPCSQPNDRNAPPRILISHFGFHCYGSQTISDNRMFRQDSEHCQSKIWRKESGCKEVAQKKGATCFGSKCEAGCDDGTAVCEPIILYCCALHSLTMKAWSIVLRWPWRLGRLIEWSC